jgi:hypothetical protein
MPLSLQSISKAFVFALVCDAIGHEEVHRRLGVNATGLAFNSVMAIELNEERTMNPMVNAERWPPPVWCRGHRGGPLGVHSSTSIRVTGSTRSVSRA